MANNKTKRRCQWQHLMLSISHHPLAHGEGIRFKPMNTTLPNCMPARMHQAYQFITKLSNVRRFDLDENGTLSLFGDGQSILKALPLPTGG